MSDQGDQGDQGVVGDQGDQGVAGPRGAPGERGVQGSSGPSGGQGIEGPAGISAEGAQGVQGERGARGARAPLRWAPAIGYVVMFALLLFLIFRVQTTCTDAKASAALRHQWARVADIIEGSQQRTPGDPGYITPKEASRQFADSYRTALQEAGPAPDCRGLFP